MPNRPGRQQPVQDRSQPDRTNSDGIIDPQYQREAAQRRAEGEAQLARIREEVAKFVGPSVLIQRCVVCGAVIGPYPTHRGEWACSARCVQVHQDDLKQQEEARSWQAWLMYRYGYGSEWVGAVNF